MLPVVVVYQFQEGNMFKFSNHFKMLSLHSYNTLASLQHGKLPKQNKTQQNTQNDLLLTNSSLNKQQLLNQLRDDMQKIDLPINNENNTLVFSDGNINSNIMLVGEAPGAEEVIQKKPFVGQSGQLLQEMLEAIELNRTKYYVINTIPWRLKDNRTPTSYEIDILRPYVHRHIQIINPKILVVIGSIAYKAIFNTVKAITSIQGKWIQYTPLQISAIIMFHPAYLLRAPSRKKDMWYAMLSLKHKIISEKL